MNEAAKKTRSARIAGHGRRPTVTFRCNRDLQSRLRDAAGISERSFSEEIERRLEQSFQAEQLRLVIREELAAIA